MIKRQLFVFLFVGISTVLIDYATYYSLIYAQLFDVNISKTIGFIVGTLFAYFANRFWTFKDNNQSTVSSLWRFIVVYTLSLTLNVAINYQMYTILNEYFSLLVNLVFKFGETNEYVFNFSSKQASLQIAYLIATFSSATLNFVCMKFFVFTNKANK